MEASKETLWQGKKKAITFSFDDGVTQDIRLIEIFNRYGLKGTFNLNSELLGKEGELDRNGRIVRHDKVQPADVRRIYEGHEVAGHTLTHPGLIHKDDAEVIRQVEEDRKNLSALCGYEVVGMAYPGGGRNADERVATLIEKHTGIKYARTTASGIANARIPEEGRFAPKKDMFLFMPSTYYIDEEFEAVVDEFLALETEEPQLLYIWGHAYEMDAEYITWEKFEAMCAKLANRSEIYYGTNRDVFGC